MKPQLNTFEPQQGKLGRSFRLTATVKGKQSKWINRVEKSDWFHVFKYLDDGNLFALHEDFTGKIFEKLDHKEVEKLLKVENYETN